ncbi:hypothetical protein HPB48_002905 [Haemaphysalis longicornis]|uniref:Uncharacterized protein n=1 Tax=Haemaphysalis longicornis TaxID=44386 RepID=A0A9J6FDQ3_HAELO|nr:hypothetical protein HPB48_002905 [Haemaphysalis longicornis]
MLVAGHFSCATLSKERLKEKCALRALGDLRSFANTRPGHPKFRAMHVVTVCPGSDKKRRSEATFGTPLLLPGKAVLGPGNWRARKPARRKINKPPRCPERLSRGKAARGVLRRRNPDGAEKDTTLEEADDRAKKRHAAEVRRSQKVPPAASKEDLRPPPPTPHDGAPGHTTGSARLSACATKAKLSATGTGTPSDPFFFYLTRHTQVRQPGRDQSRNVAGRSGREHRTRELAPLSISNLSR